MYKELLHLTSTILALCIIILSITAALFYRRKYNQQNMRLMDCVLSNNFMTKLLNEIAIQGNKQKKFSHLLENIKSFFRFQEVSLHEINLNKVTHVAGDSKQIEATEHLEKNLPIVHATIKGNSHYCSILDDKNAHIYVVPINGVSRQMIFAATTKQRDKLTTIDMEILTKGIKRILEICDSLENK
jgi:hypothetical protein